jgi:hypothetical protein
MPDLSEDEARNKFSAIIDKCVNHQFAELMEIGHRISVSMK